MKKINVLLLTGIILAGGLILVSFTANKNFGLAANKAVKIKENVDYLTVINVITPKQGQQEKIAGLLKKGISERIKDVPGFISATVHKSKDNDLVVVYAQWQDEDSLGKAVEKIQSGGAPEMMEVFTNAAPDYHPYEVYAVIK